MTGHSTADVNSPTAAADAYRVLHLLPSAPAALCADVYRHLTDRLQQSATDGGPMLVELREAYAALGSAGGRAENGGPPPRNPWELLHVRSDAPADVIELAYKFWSIRLDERPGTQAHRAALTTAGEAPRNGSVGRRDHLRPPAASETTGRLVGESGPAHGVDIAIGRRPLRIGTDPTCDVTVAGDTQRMEARVWRREDQFIFHNLSRARPALVNGQAVAWATLEDGDRLQLGDSLFRFETNAHP